MPQSPSSGESKCPAGAPRDLLGTLTCISPKWLEIGAIGTDKYSVFTPGLATSYCPRIHMALHLQGLAADAPPGKGGVRVKFSRKKSCQREHKPNEAEFPGTIKCKRVSVCQEAHIREENAQICHKLTSKVLRIKQVIKTILLGFQHSFKKLTGDILGGLKT